MILRAPQISNTTIIKIISFFIFIPLSASYSSNNCYFSNCFSHSNKNSFQTFRKREHSISNVYNPQGIRVAEIEDPDGTPQVTNYLIDPYNHTGYAQVFEETTGGVRTTYTIGDDVITQYKASTGAEQLLYDGHGSTRQLVTGSVGSTAIVDDFSYDGYGVLLQDESAASVNPGKTLTQATSLLYAGEMFDFDSQHYYNRARWYNPYNGRFNRTDPFAGSRQDPQSLHKYAYAHANPINATDPSGELATISGKIKGVRHLFWVFPAVLTTIPAIIPLLSLTSNLCCRTADLAGCNFESRSPAICQNHPQVSAIFSAAPPGHHIISTAYQHQDGSPYCTVSNRDYVLPDPHAPDCSRCNALA